MNEAEAIIKSHLDGNFWSFNDLGAVVGRSVPKNFLPNHGALYVTEQRQSSKTGKVVRPWLPIEDETLVQMKLGGKAWSEIVPVLRRGSQSCFNRWVELSRERGLPRQIVRPNAADSVPLHVKAQIVQMRVEKVPCSVIAAKVGVKEYIIKGYYPRFKREVEGVGA